MKRYLNFLITCIVAVAAVSSCNFYALDEVWDPELENVFYCGYDEWIAQRTDGTNQLKYTISNGGSATMPFRLWSEFTRDFGTREKLPVLMRDNWLLPRGLPSGQNHDATQILTFGQERAGPSS